MWELTSKNKKKIVKKYSKILQMTNIYVKKIQYIPIYGKNMYPYL